MKLHDLNTLPWEAMNALVRRQVIHSGQMTVSRLLLKKGAVVPQHHHENEQLSIVVEGSIRFDFPGESVVATAGQIVEIPPHLPHGVEVLEDCEAIDVFTPPREDWKRGDDQYLRGPSTSA